MRGERCTTEPPPRFYRAVTDMYLFESLGISTSPYLNNGDIYIWMQYLRAKIFNQRTNRAKSAFLSSRHVDTRSSRKCYRGIRRSIEIYCPELPKNGSIHSQHGSISTFPWMHLFNVPLFIRIRMSSIIYIVCVRVSKQEFMRIVNQKRTDIFRVKVE